MPTIRNFPLRSEEFRSALQKMPRNDPPMEMSILEVAERAGLEIDPRESNPLGIQMSKLGFFKRKKKIKGKCVWRWLV